MNTKRKRIITIIAAVLLIMNCSTVRAIPPKPSEGGMGGPGGPNSTDVTYKAATTISSNTEEARKIYSSSAGSENALLVTGGNSTISSGTVTKTGDSNGDNADFYGTNAAILVKDGKLNISGGNITTNGSHANAVFAYSSGIINISNATIKTTSNNSGAIMVTGGGTLTANDVTATTEGDSSAPIRSDRGGGTLTVNGGTYTANGIGSPVIYSTADITVNNAVLTSTASEGAIVEGKNSITLNNTVLTDTNTALHGNSETYKNIFIYQSMSGDAEVGNASFTANNSKITTNKGDTIFVTNTKTNIELIGNSIVNNDDEGAFLRIQSSKWGNKGSNGGDVTLNAEKQNIEGDIYVDEISKLTMSLTERSNYLGTINSSNSSKSIVVNLDSNSTLTLTGDSYITSLENEVEDNSNINLNGYTLYVGDAQITSTEYSSEKIAEDPNVVKGIMYEATKKDITISFVITIALIILAIIVFIKNRRDRKKEFE